MLKILPSEDSNWFKFSRFESKMVENNNTNIKSIGITVTTEKDLNVKEI